ncbi:hypothetical protein AMATHDRAFT_9527 [Amanita thiersii Skay4041]|uniref:Uncharacterized protein n=1 Tax=Amanita thiersii Skay4041 TaxID=703135 RepID=A0A2A9NC87_9AGAR|nr:hypothetical protein AMATHDRAFT_9527 [Amanita thiersii Skay4041]
MSSTTSSPLEIARAHLKPVVADFEPFFGLNLKRNPIPDLEAKLIAADKIMANYIAALTQQEEHPPALKFWQFLHDVMRLLAEDAQDERWNYWLPLFPLGRTYFASHKLPQKGENVLLLPKLVNRPSSPAPSQTSSRRIALYQVTPPPPEERPGHTRHSSEKARALSPDTSLVLASKKRALVISSDPSSEEEPSIPKKAKSTRPSKSGKPTTVGGSPGVLTWSARLKTPTVKKVHCFHCVLIPQSSPGFPLIKEAPIKTEPHNKAKRGRPAKKTATLPSPEVLETPAAPTTWLQACNHCRENGVFTTCTPRQIGQACVYCHTGHLGGCDFLITPAKREAARSAALPLALGSYEHLLSLHTQRRISTNFWLILRSLAHAHKQSASATHEAFMTTLAHTVQADGPGVMMCLSEEYSESELAPFLASSLPLSSISYLAPPPTSLLQALYEVSNAPPPPLHAAAPTPMPSQPLIATLNEAPPDPSPDYFSEFPDPVIKDPEDELEESQDAEA